jgi:hypothetical protein
LFDGSTKYHQRVLDNYANLFGSSTGFDPDEALITGCRIVGAGLRVYSTTEVVTDTSGQYVTEFIGGQMSPTELGSLYDTGTAPGGALRTSRYSQVYANQDGITVRYDPFQSDMQRTLLGGLQLKSSDSRAWFFDMIHLPAVVVHFSQAVATTASFPLIVHAVTWLECSLKHPTPLYAQPSPVDHNFDRIIATIVSSPEIYPFVAKGRSFQHVLRKLPQLLREADKLAAQASKLGSEYPAITSVIRAGGRALKRRRKRRKRVRRQSRRGGRGGRNNAQLGGTRAPPRMPRTVKNSR